MNNENFNHFSFIMLHIPPLKTKDSEGVNALNNQLTAAQSVKAAQRSEPWLKRLVLSSLIKASLLNFWKRNILDISKTILLILVHQLLQASEKQKC